MSTTTNTPSIKKKNLTKSKRKILMVHGYGQTADSFRRKTGAIRRSVKSMGEFDFIEATLTAPPREGLEEEHDGKAWWLWNHSHTNPINTGWKESLEQIILTLEQHGPYDAIFGFSQGASMVSLVVAEQERRNTQWFRHACFVGGFLPRMPEMRNAIVAGLQDTTIPTWHSYGASDTIIPSSMSVELVEAMGKHATVCVHPGGHLVSSSKETRSSFKQWMKSLEEDGNC